MRFDMTSLCLLTAGALLHEVAAAQTFELLTDWPQADGVVHAMRADAANNVLYLGGEFTQFGGQPRSRLAALNLTSGALLPWSPATDGTVYALEVAGDSVIVTGSFTTVNGQPRGNLASVDAATGALRNWNPGLNGAGFSLRAFSGNVYVGGSFTNANGQTRNRAAAFSGADGSLSAWHPNSPSSGIVRVIEPMGGHLLIAGLFTTIGGAARSNVAVVDHTTGLATSWQANTNAVVIAAVVGDSEVLLGGHFSTVNGTSRERIASVSADDGSLLPWAPAYTAPSAGVRAIARVPESVITGGFFQAVNGQAQLNLAAVSPGTGALLPTPFSANSTVNAIVVNNGRVLVGGSFTTVQPGGGRLRFAAFNYCTTTWFADADEDGFGNSTISQVSCNAPAGYVANNTDCDDTDPEIGEALTWYQDLDEDSFGNAEVSVVSCSQPVGYVSTDNDCDDTEPLINDANIWYFDADLDGLGDAEIWVRQCFPPPGYVEYDTDCDDSDPLVGMGTIWYRDFDGDGFGSPWISQYACDQPAGFVAVTGDCNEGDPVVFPGALCNDGDPFTVNDAYQAFPLCDCAGQGIAVSARLVLSGAYSTQTGNMRDDLRAMGLVPLIEPYSALGYEAVGVPSPEGSEILPAVLATTGPDAIVDWVILELRDAASGAIRLHTRYALVQRDGDVVDLDGAAPVRFPVMPGTYRLAALHRNHQGVVMAQGADLNGAFIDFTSPAVHVHQDADARGSVDGLMVLRAGDVTFNDVVNYVGDPNDRDPILLAIGGSTPTNTTSGYREEDTNLDGMVKYVGANNDRDPILVSIGGSTPTAVRPNYFMHTTP